MTNDLSIISLAPSMGTTILLKFESLVPFNSKVQMKSSTPQDSATLALQIQTLTANVEELTRQN